MSASPKPSEPTAPPPAPGTERNSTLVWGVIRKRPKPLIGIAYTVPVFLLYHLGILLVERRNDVDFVSTLVRRLLDASKPAYVLVTLALALLLLVTAWAQQKRIRRSERHSFGRVLAESLAAALLILMSIGWATHEVRTGEALSVPELGFFDRLVLSAGAGFHEELVFRVVLVSGAAWVLGKLTKWKHWVTLSICMVVSSVLFSLAHYFVLFDEVFVPRVAGFRVIEGLLFATLYVTRGFPVAVYAHALYDLMAFYLYS